MAADAGIDPATVALVSTIIQALIQVVQATMAQKSAAHQAVLDNLVAAGNALDAARADALAARAEGLALRDEISKEEPTTLVPGPTTQDKEEPK